ncbi:hypothetical protein B0T10DRAFT_532870 [Thelonectria olida]|uniref:Fe2OG dioxygenase domain-containing protein n=1 Tax=Thelonectria olida TaxID=1576542 RepID=A0A9P8VSD5_9HYPO|nr:hypothetical protein B0T10DRAFT_532870 [Thelonectria olida]
MSHHPSTETPVQVTYTHNDVPIPDAFLTTPPKAPITSTPIDWLSSPLPEYDGSFAVVLENVLSPDECSQLIALAEASVPREDGASAWRPALVSLGPGLEAAAPGYRESDRIIWNQQTLVDRLWERCAQADGLREQLAEVEPYHKLRGGKWLFRRPNERMRFLKYSPGQYFKPHCDGPYWYEDGDKEFQTFYTLHLYLNDSASHDAKSDLEGGATAFLNRKRDKHLDVNPKAGSVLIFQHKGLLHEGSTVIKGTKYTMRTDILYEWVPNMEEPKQAE